jgi:hypothetical protein
VRSGRAGGLAVPWRRATIENSVESKPEILSSRSLADGTTILSSASGSADLRRVAPGFIAFACTGILSGKFYEPMVAFTQREMDSNGSLVMFVDGWDLKSIHTDFREQWTQWFKQHRDRFRMRLLVRTKLMEMAANLANLFTGVNVIETYSTVHSWERACSNDFPGFRPTRREAG